MVEPTRGERIRTDATTNETSDRGRRQLPLRWVTTISRMLCCAPRIGLRAIERSGRS